MLGGDGSRDGTFGTGRVGSIQIEGRRLRLPSVSAAAGRAVELEAFELQKCGRSWCVPVVPHHKAL